jgi:hypothetical protein
MIFSITLVLKWALIVVFGSVVVVLEVFGSVVVIAFQNALRVEMY